MLNKVFVLAALLAMMAIVFSNCNPVEGTAEEGETDEVFCKPFSTCTTSLDCLTNLIYKTCRANILGAKQCCLI